MTARFLGDLRGAEGAGARRVRPAEGAERDPGGLPRKTRTPFLQDGGSAPCSLDACVGDAHCKILFSSAGDENTPVRGGYAPPPLERRREARPARRGLVHRGDAPPAEERASRAAPAREGEVSQGRRPVQHVRDRRRGRRPRPAEARPPPFSRLPHILSVAPPRRCKKVTRRSSGASGRNSNCSGRSSGASERNSNCSGRSSGASERNSNCSGRSSGASERNSNCSGRSSGASGCRWGRKILPGGCGEACQSALPTYLGRTLRAPGDVLPEAPAVASRGMTHLSGGI
jgi:hypothetical protein